MGENAIRVAKISIIGCGQIGGVLAQLCAVRELGNVYMFDITEGMPQGKALDILTAAQVDEFSTYMKGTNDYADIADSDVIIVTAGLPRKPGMSRDDLLSVNAKIIQNVGENIKKYAPNSIVIVVSNPLDAMVTLMQKVTGFPSSRVMGQAGILDSTRFATFLAWELGISVKGMNAPVLGGHGDTMVPLVRYANVAGVPVMEQFERKYGSKEKAKEKMDEIVARTRNAGGEVVSLLKTGSAFYSPAASTMQMVEAILKDEQRVMAVCAQLNGQFGISGYYVGVMCVVGKKGVEQVIELALNAEEQAMFEHSVNAVKSLVGDMEKLGF
jgi:malate dehydrogenase